VLAALERELCLGLAVDALETEHDLLGCLGLLVEYWLGLTSVSGLLAVVTRLPCAKREAWGQLLETVERWWDAGSVYLAGLVLGDLVLGVLLAVPALAVGAASLWNVDLRSVC